MKKIIPGNELALFFHSLIDENFKEFKSIKEESKGYLLNLMLENTKSEKFFKFKAEEKNQTIAEYLNSIIRESDSLINKNNSKKEFYKHLGDFVLFSFGMHEKSFRVPEVYSRLGRNGYFIASKEYAKERKNLGYVLENLGENFEKCILGFSSIKEHLNSVNKLKKQGILWYQ